MDLKAKKVVRIPVCVLFSLFLCFLFPIPISAENSVTADYWPTKNWKIASPESQGMSSKKLADMVDLVWKSSLNIDSISVVRNGYLVLDAYNNAQSKDTSHIIYSCTKSIVSALVGIAIDKGYIKGVNQPVLSFFPEKRFKNLSAEKRAMTLEHVLTMATGLHCQDSYIYSWSGLYQMLSSDDWVQFLLDLPMIEPPGTKFEYCNGASFLLSAIIQKSTGKTAFDFAKKHLFGPLGITQITWPENPQGITIGYSDIRMKPRDMAKIGYLYLNNGIWDGKQIVSSEWVEKSTRKHIPTTMMPGYGYQWWIANPGLYMAIGYQGQFIMVHPEKKLVVVFTSYLDSNSFYVPQNLMNNFILPAIQSEATLAETSDGTKALQTIVKRWQTTPYYTYKKQNKPPADVQPEETVKEYINENLGFSMKYDSELFNMKAPVIPPMIFRRKNVRGLPALSVITNDIPQGLTLENTHNHLINLIRSFSGASDFKVTNNRIITLEDGTKAGYSELNWRIQSFNLVTVSVVALKDGKLIGVMISDVKETAIESLSEMAKSLKFRK